MPASQPRSDIPRADVRTPAFRTKQELVYHTLREEILSCTLQPEQRLVIEDIARRLHVSTIPVREALQLLQSEGLVDTTPHVGATVAPLSRESIVDVFSVLEGLQMVAGRLAAVRADDAALTRLADYVKAMDEAVNRNQFDAWADLNTRFHVAISDVPGLPSAAADQRAGAGSLGSDPPVLLRRRALAPRPAGAARTPRPAERPDVTRRGRRRRSHPPALSRRDGCVSGLFRRAGESNWKEMKNEE